LPRLLLQPEITSNMIVTGVRPVGQLRGGEAGSNGLGAALGDAVCPLLVGGSCVFCFFFIKKKN